MMLLSTWRVSATLTPLVECSHNYGNGTCETFYGYVNTGPSIVRAVSTANVSANYFFPVPYARGQPTLFETGEHRNVFAVVWPCTHVSNLLLWTLDSGVAVSAQVQTCPLGCDQVPYSYATYDACGVCNGDNSACNGVAQTPNIQSNGYCADEPTPSPAPNNCGQDDTNGQAPWGSQSTNDTSFQGGGGGIKRNCTKTPTTSVSASRSPSNSRSASRSILPSTSPSSSPTASVTRSLSASSSGSSSPSASATVPPSCEVGASTTSTHTGSVTGSLTSSMSPSASVSASATALSSVSASASVSASPSVSHSATPVPSPVPSGSCPPLLVNVTVNVVDNVTVSMLPCDHEEVLRRRRQRSDAQCELPSVDAQCCTPVIQFCYAASTELEWSSLVLDFAPVADDIGSCLVDEPRTHCRVRLPPQYACGAQSVCVAYTLAELLLNCTLDGDANAPSLIVSNGSQPGHTLYNGTLYVGVAVNWPQINDADVRNDYATCNATGVVLRHSAHPFGIELNANGATTNVACYELVAPALDAYVSGVWWLPNGEVHLKLTTRLEILGGGGNAATAASWLRDARVYLPRLEGVEFEFVEALVPCDTSAPDAATVCTQHWLLESVGGVDDQDFSGLKPLLFDVYVQGYGEIRVAHIDLVLSLHRYWHVEQMTQELSATLVLARDRTFGQVYTQPPEEVASWPFFHDCDMICAELSLCISGDWADYFNMVVDRVQICTCPDQLMTLPFDPNDPEHTGCNTPGLQDLVSILVYDRESNYVNDEFNFTFVSDPPTLRSSQEAFCWLSKNLGSMRYLMQVQWFATGHPAPQQQQPQKKRGLLYDGTTATTSANPLTSTHGSASNVFTVGCDEHLHIFVPGHGCRPKHDHSHNDYWNPWILLVLAVVGALLIVLCMLFFGSMRGCQHHHHEYPLLIQEIQRPAHPHHHHHHHHQHDTPSMQHEEQQWGIMIQGGSGGDGSDTQNLLANVDHDRAPRRHHHRLD